MFLTPTCDSHGKLRDDGTPVEALRFEACSPTCANWLRYGITPKDPRKGLVPGACNGKAHQPGHLGHAGRRVLVARKWSGKTLATTAATASNS
jgi:hypothetical protein